MEDKKLEFAPIIGVLAALAVWTVLSAIIGNLRRFLPWPWEVLLELIRILGTQQCWLDVALTSSRTIIAFAIGMVFGAPIGLLLGLNKKYYEVFRVAIDFIRSIPVTALFPVAMLFLGIGDIAKMACISLGCALIILVNSAGAVENVPFIYGLVVRALRLNRRQAFWKVTFPAALPEIANGLRVAASIALILVVVLEMFVGSSRGLGLRLYDDQQLFRIHDMYATLILIGSLGYLANWVIVLFQNRFIHWSGK